MAQLKSAFVSSLFLSLLFVGCAGAQRADVERDLRYGAVSRTVYQLPLPAVWDGVQAVLGEHGYRPLAGHSGEDFLLTEWQCSQSHCNSLKVLVRPLAADRYGVVVLRSAYEGGSSVVVQTDRAYDIEWALLRRLDPTTASAIEASAKAHVDDTLKAQADFLHP